MMMILNKIFILFYPQPVFNYPDNQYGSFLDEIIKRQYH